MQSGWIDRALAESGKNLLSLEWGEARRAAVLVSAQWELVPAGTQTGTVEAEVRASRSGLHCVPLLCSVSGTAACGASSSGSSLCRDGHWVVVPRLPRRFLLKSLLPSGQFQLPVVSGQLRFWGEARQVTWRRFLT